MKAPPLSFVTKACDYQRVRTMGKQLWGMACTEHYHFLSFGSTVQGRVWAIYFRALLYFESQCFLSRPIFRLRLCHHLEEEQA